MVIAAVRLRFLIPHDTLIISPISRKFQGLLKMANGPVVFVKIAVTTISKENKPEKTVKMKPIRV